MRLCGILMPIFSLPSKYGIGTLGSEAKRFVDFLEKAGQSYWQILPLTPTNYGDSPYQSFSSFAGNPYFIDIETLIEDKLIDAQTADSFDFGDDFEKIDYGKLYENRLTLLRVAFKNFKKDNDYINFVEKNSFWLNDYSLFMALKNANDDKSWQEWEKPLRLREAEAIEDAKLHYAEDIEFYNFVQYQFGKQWKSLKKYANSKGVSIIGDIPIYVALDSADVWSNPKQFLLNEDLEPTVVAGVPPDAFSEEGQLWGNPIYNWELMEKDNFSWWKRYLGSALEKYDIVRIDHFRAFDSYYCIKAGSKTAQDGVWRKGPGMDLFKAIKAKLGKTPIIAEDLGFLTPSVKRLLKQSKFPGMKVLQFAFDSREESDYLPHNYTQNCVVYTGTHDNDTILGWQKTSKRADVRFAKKYLNCKRELNWGMISAAMASVGDTAIITMQDILGLGSEARMNIPSTVGENWKWRILKKDFKAENFEKLLYYTKLYSRMRKD